VRKKLEEDVRGKEQTKRREENRFTRQKEVARKIFAPMRQGHKQEPIKRKRM